MYVAKGAKACQKPLPLNTACRVSVKGVEIFCVYRESKDRTTLPEA